MTDDAFAITVHAKERILEVRYPRAVTPEAYGLYELAVRDAIVGLGAPWDCLVDQGLLTVMPPEVPPRIAQLNAWALTTGMRRTARVVKDSAMAQLQVGRILRASGVAQVGTVYGSREAAWHALTQAQTLAGAG